MSCRARDWAWAQSVSPPQKLVLLALAEHADQDGACWPSLTRIADLTGLARSTVAEALNGVEASGLVCRERGSSGRSTRYQLRLAGIAAAPGAGLAECGSPGDGPPVARESQQDGPGGGPAVVRQSDQGGPGAGPVGPGAGPSLVRAPDPNRQLNRQEPSGKTPKTAPSARGSRRRSPAGPIPPDWRPGERVAAWAAAQGMTPAWVAEQVAEFVVYWADRGESRASWDATFMNRLRRLQEQACDKAGQHHAGASSLAGKDYRDGATPLDRIPWLRCVAER